MRLLIRTVIVLAIVWIGLLLSGYGVLMGAKKMPRVWVSSVNILQPGG